MFLYKSKKGRINLEHRGFIGIPLQASEHSNKNQPAEVLAKDEGYNWLRKKININYSLWCSCSTGILACGLTFQC